MTASKGDETMAPLAWPWWASHPDCLRRRVRVSLVLSAVVTAFLGFVILAYEALPRVYGLAWLASMSAAAGFFLSVALGGRLALRRGRRGQSASGGLDDAVVDWRIVLAGLLTGLVLVTLGIQSAKISATGRLLLQLSAAMPIVILFIATAPPLRLRSRLGIQLTRLLLLLAFIVTGGFVFVALVDSIANQVMQVPAVATLVAAIPFLDEVRRSFELTLIFTVAAGVVATLLFLLQAESLDSKKPAQTDEQSQKDPTMTAETAAGGPPWHRQVCEALRDTGFTVTDPEELQIAMSVAPLAGSEPESMWFVGVTPTVDQIEVLRQFARKYRSLLDGLPVPLPNKNRPSPDLLVSGYPGSGRTTTAIACAVFAAVCRGQRVLFIASSEERADRTWMRLNGRLARLHLGTHFSAGRVPQVQIRPEAVVPSILVGTVPEVEDHLFKHQSQDPDLTRSLLISTQVIIVDDLLEIPEPSRSYVPFILDRHRLLLGAEFLPVQSLLICSNIGGSVAEDVVAERLFPGLLDGPILQLRPRQPGKCWISKVSGNEGAGDLGPDTFDVALKQIARSCLSESRSLVVIEPRSDREERHRLEQTLRGLGTGFVKVVADPDELVAPSAVPDLLGIESYPETPESSIDVAVYRSIGHHCSSIAVRLNMGHDDPLLLVLGGQDGADMQQDSGDMGVPLFVSAKSPALQAAFLYSALRFMPEGVPIPLQMFANFGLRPDEQPTKQLRRSDTEQMYPLIELDIPPPDIQTLEHGWPTAIVRQRPDGGTGFSTLSPLGTELRVHTYLNHAGVPIATIKDQRRPGEVPLPLALWYFQDQLKTTTDLIHLSELRVNIGTSSLVAESLERVEQGLRINTVRIRPGSRAQYLPVWDLRWDVSPDFMPGDEQLGPDYALSWIVCYESERKPLIATAEAELIGQMDEYGGITSRHDIRFDYRITPWPVILAPERYPREEADSIIRQALSGHWETGKGSDPGVRFMPALTGAFNYALNRYLDGAAYYGRYLAFRLSNNRARLGKVVIWCLEPEVSSETVSPVLAKILRDLPMRRCLFARMDYMLTVLASQTPEKRVRLLRGEARVGFEGDEDTWDVEEAQTLVHSVLSATDEGSPLERIE
ncbi:MAG: hypothetical protein N2111_13780 [Candidatus Sumerlaeaceae bacterium]|nr:hypothetical protein [Candidatus Sumerlaeaceae bacterium]